jgi:hypothetical protein
MIVNARYHGAWQRFLSVSVWVDFVALWHFCDSHLLLTLCSLALMRGVICDATKASDGRPASGSYSAHGLTRSSTLVGELAPAID